MFSIPKIESVERIVDEDPNIYVKRAERFIQEGLWFSALKECNIAVKIASDTYENESHFIYECAKILFRLGKYFECRMLIEKNLDKLKSDFTYDKYNLVVQKLTECKKKSNFRSILIDNNQVEIRYLHTQGIRTVELIGDLANDRPIILKKEREYWSIKFNNLKIGLYNYKFMVNNNVELDVHNEFITYDNENYNNIFVITRSKNVDGERKLLEDGADYIGKLVGGKPNGIGMKLGKTGGFDYYAYCNFKDGELDGDGVFCLDNSQAEMIHVGRFKNDELIKGILLFKTKEINSSSVKEGNFKKVKLDGYGKSTDSDGITWEFSEGEYKEGTINGKGKRNFYSEGVAYEGDLVNDLPHGYGVEKFNLGQKYEGNFANGKFNGKGTCTWQDKQKFSGEFLNGRIGNYGEYTIPDVGSYKGYVKNTNKNSLMFHGKGVFRFINGDVYDGEFTNHNYHGRGKYIDKDGKVLEGKFSNGKFIGQSSEGCYLTTAMCTILGKPDDCYELEALRTFRDKSLITTEKGKELVDEYYRIAPEVSEKLYAHICRDKIATNMKDKYINRIIDLIEENKDEKAILCYKDMVNYVIEAVKN